MGRAERDVWAAHLPTSHIESNHDSIKEFLAELGATEARHGLSGHIGVAIVVAELFQRRDVSQSEECDPREPGVMVTEYALLEDVGVARVIEEAAQVREFGGVDAHVSDVAALT